MTTKPKSPFEKAGGMYWFPRMIDKIRLHSSEKLHPDFHGNLGLPMSVDGFCCRFLRVDYGELKNRTLEGGTDDELLQWCFDTGRALDATDLMIWNEFIRKFGWNDIASRILKKFKAESNLSDREDIQTLPEYMEVDEGRKA